VQAEPLLVATGKPKHVGRIGHGKIPWPEQSRSHKGTFLFTLYRLTELTEKQQANVDLCEQGSDRGGLTCVHAGQYIEELTGCYSSEAA